jgi:hypothetical protein
VVPFATASVLVSLRPTPGWTILLGPEVSLFTAHLRGSVRSSEVFSTDTLTLGPR